MAEKRIEFADIYEPNLFQNLIQSGKKAENVLERLRTGFSKVIKESAKIANDSAGTLEGIERVTAAFAATTEAVERLRRVELELEKLRKVTADTEAKRAAHQKDLDEMEIESIKKKAKLIAANEQLKRAEAKAAAGDQL